MNMFLRGGQSTIGFDMAKILHGLCFTMLLVGSEVRSEGPRRPAQARQLFPFLELFHQKKEPTIGTQNVRIQSAIGPVQAYLARPETSERLPAVLLIPDRSPLTAWMKENARDLAGIGYVTLAIELTQGPERSHAKLGNSQKILNDEKSLAQLSAAVRWLWRRPDVLPNRIGVVGWSEGAEQALALAASAPLQACVTCDGAVTDEASVIAGLRGTPVLGVFSGKNQNVLPSFEKALERSGNYHKMVVYNGVESGFMCPTNQRVYAKEAADKAFVEIYEFLGKYVEDTPQNLPFDKSKVLPSVKSYATIVDIMHSVNEPTGVRGRLIQMLATRPGNQREWEVVQANGALIAEAGNLLQVRAPSKGSRSHWLEQVNGFSAVAEGIVEAAKRQDYAEAQRGLQKLSACCASCHRQHR